jgi:hypothetical protein
MTARLDSTALDLGKAGKTLQDVLSRVLRFEPPLCSSRATLLREYAEAVGSAEELAVEMHRFAKVVFGVDVPRPAARRAGADVAALPYEEAEAALMEYHENFIKALAQTWDRPEIGRITWFAPDACRFVFFEVVTSRTLTVVTRRRVQRAHDLVSARSQHVWSAPLVLPQAARRVVAELPPALVPHIELVHGVEILEGQSVISTSVEPTLLGKMFGAVGQGIRALGRGIDSLVQVARRDPALTLGEFVLCGWEQGEAP